MRFIGLIALFAVAVGLVIWITSPATAPPDDATPSVVAPMIEAPTAPAEPISAPVVAVSADVPPVEPPDVTGQVLFDVTGHPVVGAKVRLWEPAATAPLAEAETGVGGEFSFPRIAAGAYSLEAEYADHYMKEGATSLTVEAERPAGFVEIPMAVGGAVAGRVYDRATGEGLAGVRVRADRGNRLVTETGEDGRYRIDGIRPGSTAITREQVKGYVRDHGADDGLRIDVVAGEVAEDVDFALLAGTFGTISGRVVHLDGSAVSGATVTVSENGPMSMTRMTEGTSGADGAFQIADVEIGSGIWVEAAVEGYASQSAGPLTLGEGGIDGVELTLVPLASIRGVVVDREGAPVRDSGTWTGSGENFYVETSVVRQGRNWVGQYGTHIEDDGTFDLSGLPAGRYGLLPLSDRGGSGIFEPQVTVDVADGAPVEGVELTYDLERLIEARTAAAIASSSPAPKREKPREIEITGQVVSRASGEPVTRYELSADVKRVGMTQHLQQSVSNAEGVFALTAAESATVDLRIEAEGFAPYNVSLGAQEQHLTIRLDPGSTISGVVTDGEGQPIAGASLHMNVDIRRYDAFGIRGVERDALSGADGTFTIGSLGPEPQRLFASHPEYAIGVVDVTPGRSGAQGVEVVLLAGGAVEGGVYLNGAPFEGRGLMVLDGDGVNIVVDPVRSDGDGQFRIGRLAQGSYTIYTSLDEPHRMQFREFEILDGETTRVDFQFGDAPRSVSGTVTLDSATPAYVTVRLDVRTAYGRETFIPFRPSTTGDYRFENLPEGDATLSATARDANGAPVTEVLEFTIGGEGDWVYDVEIEGAGR